MMSVKLWRVLLASTIINGFFSAASPGDNLDEFIDCCDACEYQRKCPNSWVDWVNPEENVFAKEKFSETPIILSKFLFWDCIADCDYQCQQIITQIRIINDEEIYQFHGKWPFLRLFTMQELFSTIFSIGNFFPHYYSYLKITAKINKIKLLGVDVQRTKILQNYLYVAIAGMCAWTASSIFHWRDLIITEKFDYFFAGMTVLMGFHAIFARLTHLDRYPKLGKYFSGSVAFIFFLHVLRLYIDWSYTYNMRFNIFFGIMQYLLLLTLALQNYLYLKTERHNISRSIYLTQSQLIFKLCIVPVLMVVGTSMAMSLELFDFFIFDYQIDAHAIWHLCTIWPSWVLYSFFTDDYDLVLNKQIKN
ncbi:similar to Saccharomyces cerevisiae YCR044C PER1 Protein of the endoplasmic reticulum [Maudiozyma saulgeensis]|uniref:Post-GPI attachment to proteins factor 3 n=1 Tax=Maudiozyma saulgeensis TaxID=1789683 RepID=A0A1X7R370_9SACH|nr:similar to Saccharomyces cerevisiae YCR044C PER1 Protein of the endoplasmic reticulum [Kazachstania saulgeensis]